MCKGSSAEGGEGLSLLMKYRRGIFLAFLQYEWQNEWQNLEKVLTIRFATYIIIVYLCAHTRAKITF